MATVHYSPSPGRAALIAAALVVALSVWWIACDASESVVTPGADALAHEATPVAEQQPPPNHGQFEGAVVIRTVDELRVVVSLDEAKEDGGPDGLVDRVFTLQTETPLQDAISADLARAQLTLVNGNLFVDPASGERGLRLQTAGFDLSAATRLSLGDRVALASVNQTLDRRTVSGIGLAQQVVSTTDRFALARARNASEYASVATSACAASWPFGALGGDAQRALVGCSDGACMAGGPGSDGCSKGGCTVSCGDGYYSCCDGATCQCCRA